MMSRRLCATNWGDVDESAHLCGKQGAGRVCDLEKGEEMSERRVRKTRGRDVDMIWT